MVIWLPSSPPTSECRFDDLEIGVRLEDGNRVGGIVGSCSPSSPKIALGRPNWTATTSGAVGVTLLDREVPVDHLASVPRPIQVEGDPRLEVVARVASRGEGLIAGVDEAGNPRRSGDGEGLAVFPSGFSMLLQPARRTTPASRINWRITDRYCHGSLDVHFVDRFMIAATRDTAHAARVVR